MKMVEIILTGLQSLALEWLLGYVLEHPEITRIAAEDVLDVEMRADVVEKRMRRTCEKLHSILKEMS